MRFNIFRFFKDFNFISTLGLAIKTGQLGRFQVRGKAQIRLDPSAKIIFENSNQCLIGIPLKGLVSSSFQPTMIGAGPNSQLSLAGSIIGRSAILNAGAGAKIFIGEGSYLNDGSQIYANQEVRIGKNCVISWNVTILDDDGHGMGAGPSCKPIKIEDRVWVGCNVTILKGVTIGEGSVVAAGAVVNRSCPPRSLIGGVPAKVIQSDVEWSNL